MLGAFTEVYDISAHSLGCARREVFSFERVRCAPLEQPKSSRSS